MPRSLLLLACLSLLGCNDRVETTDQDDFEAYVARHKVGAAVDQWVEMKSTLTGQWDRTVLVFGYYDDDAAECEKVVRGLKAANPKREYRCTPAQR